MKRSRIKPMSDKRRKLKASHAAIREQMYERDGFRCRLDGVLRSTVGACFGPLTPHHVLKASQGGTYTLDNLVTLCAHHNDRLEADADFARLAVTLGLVVRRSA